MSPWKYEPYQGDVVIVGGPKALTKAQKKLQEKKYMEEINTLRKQKLEREEEFEK